jgi:hypothetical protein
MMDPNATAKRRLLSLALSLLLAATLSCAPEKDEALVPSGGNEPYEALIFAPKEGCTCSFLDAYENLEEAAKNGGIPAQIRVVTSSETMSHSLEARGLDSKKILMDPDGRLSKEFRINEKDLPFFVLLKLKPRARVFAALRLSPVSGEQKLAGQILLTVNSFSAGQ